jgi:hypothetical protein
MGRGVEGFKGGDEVEVVVNGDGATEGGRRKGLNVEQRGGERGTECPMANL